ncbi:HAD family hydrolase [Alcanivorax hongdengensis A-11-3]|uniref:HAD family hydrolase n=1 Tax=Alcanivorax hongdengensis A-11-3 TaxID=1177179 RepID=L0W9L2_9GAMM|nr:HAD family hydrolase [Alcanivorax hongdengensis A-11-3]
MRSAIAFVLPALVGMIVFVLSLPLGRRRAANNGIYLVTRLGLMLAGIRLQVQGDAALLRQRPAVYVINHQSGTDPIIIAWLLRRDIVAIAKHELCYHPLLGPMMRMLGAVFVKREQGVGPQVLAPLLPKLARGYAVGLAPEGRRSRDGTLQPFKGGALWLAQQAGVPLIPIVLHNSGDILPARGHLIRPGTVRVTLLPPVPATLTAEQLQKVFADALAR